MTMGYILAAVANNKKNRLFTIEVGNREFDLVLRNKLEQVINSVMSTVTRESNDPKQVVTAQMLLEQALTFHPKYICMSEMKGSEAFETVEAALTGHDYFFARAIDKTRPGGMIVFITSKGTLDKVNNSVRKYIAQRAELIGAIRLPNTAMKTEANTEVTSDIIFLKKRERMPCSSAANLYPFSYSGKTDPDGMYVGKDNNGSNIIVNFDRRSQDKTNGHILILGNSGEGKSFLVKLLITNFRQMGKRFFILDPDDEYKDTTINEGGCYIDMMSGRYFINVLEPRLWTVEPVSEEEKEDVPVAFRKGTRLSQHIAYLRDFFKCYKDFSTEQLDTLEILLEKLYVQFNICDDTDFGTLHSEDYPILSDLFALGEKELENYRDDENQLYTKDTLRSLILGLRSISVGSESTFFNGHTNIINADFIDFSVKGMLETNENLKNAMFLNIFSYMIHQQSQKHRQIMNPLLPTGEEKKKHSMSAAKRLLMEIPMRVTVLQKCIFTDRASIGIINRRVCGMGWQLQGGMPLQNMSWAKCINMELELTKTCSWGKNTASMRIGSSGLW